ncbi:hypothetical protein T01_4724 [Trichinella spiralis]|uniref:Uncharacterized protein n=1 Tax=Trichinella spiralis TaxID=6334 RepID=A0A0V1AKY0_TRISP|nr:hypothetical protein T01_6030 [Trichinella spiralis]KRY25696.1 hypothetical protein T01_11716 [Trichinella spiralis]KRY33809.1 hypothetical protein T01_4724 [Trichinella spiralis]
MTAIQIETTKTSRNISTLNACYQQYQATTRSSTVIKLNKTAYRLHPLLKEKEDEYLAAME